jgi:hypothetical protein
MHAVVIVAAAGLAVLAACAGQRPMAPVAAQWTPCDTAAGGRCNVRIVRDPNGTFSCDLDRFRVEPAFLGLTGNRPVNIQWDVPEGFAFCDGDGIRLKPGWRFAQPQVLESYSSDSKDGGRLGFDASGACKPFRNWRWLNSPPGEIVAYEIQFSERSTLKTCKIDPWIRNG